MKQKSGMMLVFPLLVGFIYILGAPILAWLRTLVPGFSGWVFWPAAGLLLSSISLSYALPAGRLSAVLHIIGEAIMPLTITLTALVIPADILWLLWRDMPVRAVGWVVLALYILVCAVGLVNARRVRAKEYVLSPAKPWPPLRVGLISDLHLGAFTSRGMTRRTAAAIIGCQPDIVIIAGDIFDGSLIDLGRRDEVLAQLKRITDFCPVFACEGNHDLFDVSGEKDAFIREAGIRLLRDEVIEYRGLSLAFRRDAHSEKRLPPQELLANADREKPLIVADHSPAEIEKLWEAGADLVLSGHTHGGQTFPANLLYRLGPVLSYGVRQQDGRYAIVTSGAGAYGIPIRLGVNNEVVAIKAGG